MKIKDSLQKIVSRQILDSRTSFTTEIDMHTIIGSFRASCPSGASTGSKEAFVLHDPTDLNLNDNNKDNDKDINLKNLNDNNKDINKDNEDNDKDINLKNLNDNNKDNKDIINNLNDIKTVNNALFNIQQIILPKLLQSNIKITHQKQIDQFLCEIDGTENKCRLGANAILPVSMAFARAGAAYKNIGLKDFINRLTNNDNNKYNNIKKDTYKDININDINNKDIKKDIYNDIKDIKKDIYNKDNKYIKKDTCNDIKKDINIKDTCNDINNNIKKDTCNNIKDIKKDINIKDIKKDTSFNYFNSFSYKNVDLRIPIPNFNIINGGMHSGNNLQFQEIMVAFFSPEYSQNLMNAVCFYRSLKRVIENKFGRIYTSVGDEGGFAPPVDTLEDALDLVMETYNSNINNNKYSFKDMRIGIDCAASSFYCKETKKYLIYKNKKEVINNKKEVINTSFKDNSFNDKDIKDKEVNKDINDNDINKYNNKDNDINNDNDINKKEVINNNKEEVINNKKDNDIKDKDINTYFKDKDIKDKYNKDKEVINNDKEVITSSFKDSSKDYSDGLLSGEELVCYYESIVEKYPLIYSIEDPFDEADFGSWRLLMDRLGGRIRIVGDDLTVTNKKMVGAAVVHKLCNTLLVKINQIGTVHEAIETANLARRNNMHLMVSHRSGETEDCFLTDFAVGIGAEYIKCGAPCRGERVCKYNHILRLEEVLNEK